jgi:class 3 adenylate cyclase
MERKRKIIAALADLRQEIAGTVPVDIVSKWSTSSRSAEMQTEILRPFERRGFLVSSDSAGLSRLTAERSLLEVMNIVSIPKESIFAVGRAIGGRGLGVWAADNTEMFYDEKVGARQVVEAMAAAQKHIHSGLLQVGIGIDYGTFWEIGLGMFGMEAEILEEVAEDQTSAKEIILSETVREHLEKDFATNLVLREDLKTGSGFYTLNYDNYGDHLIRHALEFDPFDRQNLYPLPFDSDFFMALKQMEASEEARIKLEKYFVDKTVILIKIYHQKTPLLLNQLTDWVVMNAVLNEIAVKYDLKMVKSNGELGIFVADSQTEAVEFAEDVLLSLRKTQDSVSIGLSAGEILLFDLDQGGMEIAGGPVNIASKISEDIVERNTLFVHETVKIPATHSAKFEPFSMEKSSVTLRGQKYVK